MRALGAFDGRRVLSVVQVRQLLHDQFRAPAFYPAGVVAEVRCEGRRLTVAVDGAIRLVHEVDGEVLDGHEALRVAFPDGRLPRTNTGWRADRHAEVVLLTASGERVERSFRSVPDALAAANMLVRDAARFTAETTPGLAA